MTPSALEVGTSPRLARLLAVVGVVWIAIGVGINEWVLAASFSVEHLEPGSRLAVRIFDVACVLLGVMTLRNRNRPFVGDLNVLLLSTAGTLVLAELGLRAFPTALGQSFTNGLLTRYSTGPGGISYYDPVVGMNFQLPNHRTVMYYNGYRWNHETDAMGFRNPATRERADVVLLGDSFIYGHGVNVEQTVGHFLEATTGLAVANLARQGDASLQQAYLLTTYIDRFQLRYVVYFFYENDIRDLYAYREDSELRAFIDTPIDEIRYQTRLEIDSAVKLKGDQDCAARSASLFCNAGQRLYLLKILQWMGFQRRAREVDARSAAPSHDIDDEGSLGWRYTKHAIRYMDRVARAHQARFIIVPITPARKQHFSILQRFAAAENIPFLDSSAIGRRDGSLFLPGDGHFSEKGARVMAGLVARFLGQAPPRTTSNTL